MLNPRGQTNRTFNWIFQAVLGIVAMFTESMLNSISRPLAAVIKQTHILQSILLCHADLALPAFSMTH